jgi:hypothetical protein
MKKIWRFELTEHIMGLGIIYEVWSSVSAVIKLLELVLNSNILFFIIFRLQVASTEGASII